MEMIERAFYFIIVLGSLVFVHELGHFLAAKLFKVRVEVFSLGFGPRLAGFRKGDTDYRVAAVPLGGYVKMAGEYEESVDPDDPSLFNAKPRWQRLIVFFAGPAMNVLLTIFIWWGMFIVGIDGPATSNILVGAVEPDSPAAVAGLAVGDRILRIAGRDIESLDDYGEEVALRPGQRVVYEIEREGAPLEFTLELGSHELVGVGTDGVYPGGEIHVAAVLPGRASEAGLMQGDVVASVDGQPVASLPGLIEIIKTQPEKSLEFLLRRDGEELALMITPEATADGGKINATLTVPMRTFKYGLFEAFPHALSKTWDHVVVLGRTLKALFTMQIGLKSISGPLEIARISHQVAQYGLQPFLGLIAFISINLGIFNLLPIPVLDGGNILVLLVESSIRRDLSPAIKERILQVGFVFLITFAVLVVGMDVRKSFILRRLQAEHRAEQQAEQRVEQPVEESAAAEGEAPVDGESGGTTPPSAEGEGAPPATSTEEPAPKEELAPAPAS